MSASFGRSWGRVGAARDRLLTTPIPARSTGHAAHRRAGRQASKVDTPLTSVRPPALLTALSRDCVLPPAAGATRKEQPVPPTGASPVAGPCPAPALGGCAAPPRTGTPSDGCWELLLSVSQVLSTCPWQQHGMFEENEMKQRRSGCQGDLVMQALHAHGLGAGSWPAGNPPTPDSPALPVSM